MRPIQMSRDPRVLAALMVAVLGCLDAVLGAVAPLAAPTVFWPLWLLEGHVAAVSCGLVLLLLARGLRRGLRAAWVVTLVLLLQVALTAPLDHDEWTVLALLPVAVLWVHRKSFTAAARASKRGAAALLAGLAVLLSAGSEFHDPHGARARYIRFAHVVRAAGGDHAAKVHHLAAYDPGMWMLLPIIGIGVVIMLVGLRGLTLPGLPRMGADKRRWHAQACRLFAAHGANGVGYFATAPDKTVWADLNVPAVVGFRLIGATALVVGDPLATADNMPDVIDRFLGHCRANGWTPAFYQTLGQTLPLYRARGLHALAIGREAIIDLPAFALSGKRIANVRHSVTHAERAGMRVRIFKDTTLDAETRDDLSAISAEWLAGKGGGELGFTMGQLAADGRPTPGARVAVAYDSEGTAQAFITLVPAGGGRGWMLDLMRRRHTAASGTMELLIARTAEALRDEGYAIFSLSLAPMASAEDDDEDAPAVARSARTLLYEKMGGAYNYKTLFAFKKKFGVRWETRYLVYAGDAALPATLYAVARAHLPPTIVPIPALAARRAHTWADDEWVLSTERSA